MLPKQPPPSDDTVTTTSSLGGSSGFSSFANGDYQSDIGSVSPSPAHGKYCIVTEAKCGIPVFENCDNRSKVFSDMRGH